MRKLLYLLFSITYIIGTISVTWAATYPTNEIKAAKGVTILYEERFSDDEVSIHKKTSTVADDSFLGVLYKIDQHVAYKASPDHKKIAISWPNTIGIWDEDHLVSGIPTTFEHIKGTIWSSDSNSVLFLNQIGNPYEYKDITLEVYTYDLIDNKLKNLGVFPVDEFASFFDFDLRDWRNNRIYMLVGYEGSEREQYVIDLNTNKIRNLFEEKNWINDWFGGMSTRGTYIVKEEGPGSSSVFFSCDGDTMVPYYPSKYFIYDSLTGEKKGNFGVPGKAIEFVGFSPDEKEVFFDVAQHSKKYFAECNSLNWEEPKRTYYRKKIADPYAHPIKLTGKRELLSLLYPNQIIFRRSEVHKDDWEFLKNGTVFFRLPDPDHRIQIIEAY